MSEHKAVTYQRSQNQNPLGNTASNILEWIVSGSEANADTILMATFGANNTYLSLKLTCSTTSTATVNIGYESRDPDESDNLTYFATAAVLTNAIQEFIVAPKGPDFAHDIVMTVVAIGDLAAADVITVITKSMVSS